MVKSFRFSMQDTGSFVTGCHHFLPYKVVLTALFDCCMHWIHPQGLLSLFFGKNETIENREIAFWVLVYGVGLCEMV